MYLAVLVPVTIDLDRIKGGLISLLNLRVQLCQLRRNRSAGLNADAGSNACDISLPWPPLYRIVRRRLTAPARFGFQALRAKPIDDGLCTFRSKKICFVIDPGIHFVPDSCAVSSCRARARLSTLSNLSRAAFSAAISSTFAISGSIPWISDQSLARRSRYSFRDTGTRNLTAGDTSS